MSLFRSSLIVSAFTLLSRIFGFLRDVVIANVMGAGLMTDAFFVAFKIPNFLRRLFAEGAFNAAFLPMFAGMLKVDGKKPALHFASSVMTSLLCILLVITAIVIAFMPDVIYMIAPGFRDKPELSELTITLTRITFPYLVFISMISLLGGILNSHDRFAAVAFTPVLLNLSLVLSLLLLPAYVPTHAHAISVGVFIAGAVQLLWLIYVNIRNNSLPRLIRPHYDAQVKKMLKAFAPVAFGAGVAQVNQLIDIVLATYLETAVSYLYYADRLYELPLGVIGIAVATALLPMLSKHIRAGEMVEANAAIDQALRFVSLIGLPATAALIVLADPIITTIYEHGEFSTSDSAAVIPALIAYSCGLPAFLLIKIFANSFFAAQDTKTPVKIAVLCMLTNLVLNLILIEYYAHVGLAIATSIAGWLNASLLGITLYRRDIFRPSRALCLYMVKLCIAVALMATLLLGLHGQIADWFTDSTRWRAGGMVLLVSAGGAGYFAAVFASKALTMQEIRQWVRK